jgi:hypothetical protein
MNEHDIDKPTSTDFTIKLRNVNSDKHAAPAIVRLRRLLKCCLRGFGFRAIYISPDEGENNERPATKD